MRAAGACTEVLRPVDGLERAGGSLLKVGRKMQIKTDTWPISLVSGADKMALGCRAQTLAANSYG